MSLVFSSDPTLVEKHKHYLDMIKWDIPPSSPEPPVKAFKCQINPGVLDPQGKQVIQRPRIWVDDALMAAIGVLQMKMVLASIIEAIFTVMGEPDTSLRQCPLAMDKWTALVVGEKQLALGLILNTRKLSASITPNYLANTLSLIQTT